MNDFMTSLTVSSEQFRDLQLICRRQKAFGFSNIHKTSGLHPILMGLGD
jgi:hypothetical protein